MLLMVLLTPWIAYGSLMRLVVLVLLLTTDDSLLCLHVVVASFNNRQLSDVF
jgi:hypothetical protein